MSNSLAGVGINQTTQPTPVTQAQILESTLLLVIEQSAQLSNISENLCSRVVGSCAPPTPPEKNPDPKEKLFGLLEATNDVLQQTHFNLANALRNLQLICQETST